MSELEEALQASIIPNGQLQSFSIADIKGTVTVCGYSFDNISDVQEIYRRVNSYDMLVEALEDIITMVDNLNDIYDIRNVAEGVLSMVREE